MQTSELSGTHSNAKPVVSVIIPAYNSAAFLETAVLSAQQQTLANIEIIIINDGSSDNTLQIAQDLAQDDSRVRVISFATNGGKPHAMNQAMAEASGIWIAVLDSDDWYDPSRLEKLIAAAEADKVDIVADNLTMVDIQARVNTGTFVPEQGERFRIDLDGFLKNSNIAVTFGDYGILKPIVRAQLIKDNNISYHEKASFGEDFYFLFLCLLSGGTFLFIDTPFYYYVQPIGSVSEKASHDQRLVPKFEVVGEIHQEFETQYFNILTKENQNRMRQRAAGIKIMISFHQIKGALHRKSISDLLKYVASAPTGFWSFVGARVLSRAARVSKRVRLRRSPSRQNQQSAFYFPTKKSL